MPYPPRELILHKRRATSNRSPIQTHTHPLSRKSNSPMHQILNYRQILHTVNILNTHYTVFPILFLLKFHVFVLRLIHNSHITQTHVAPSRAMHSWAARISVYRFGFDFGIGVSAYNVWPWFAAIPGQRHTHVYITVRWRNRRRATVTGKCNQIAAGDDDRLLHSGGWVWSVLRETDAIWIK